MRTAILLVLAVLPACVWAQTDPVTGKAALGYLSTSGNTESTNANAAFELLWDRERPWMHEWTAMAINASSGGTTTAEAYAAGYEARREFSETSYLFTAANWRQDRFSGYDEQLTETVGYGRRLLETERHMLALEGGLGAKQSTLNDGTEVDEGIVRLGLDYTLGISERSEFKQKLLYEAGGDNRYMETVSALSADIIGELALVISYTIKNNSDVPPGIEETDTFTAISLEYAF